RGEGAEERGTVKRESNGSARIAVKRAAGGRTEAAAVPPPSALPPPDERGRATQSPDEVVNKLRALADPEVTGFERGLSGGAGGPGRGSAPRSFAKAPSEASPSDRTLYQTKVSSYIQNAMDVTTQAVLSADRRSVRISATPVFNTLNVKADVRVVSPVFPGSP